MNNNSEYYFGSNSKFNPSIPTPEDFFGFPIGSELVRYDRVVEYFRLLDQLSDRAQLKVIGHSHENREYVILHISTPENIKNLESIRQNLVCFNNPVSPADLFVGEGIRVSACCVIQGSRKEGKVLFQIIHTDRIADTDR